MGAVGRRHGLPGEPYCRYMVLFWLEPHHLLSVFPQNFILRNKAKQFDVRQCLLSAQPQPASDPCQVGSLLLI